MCSSEIVSSYFFRPGKVWSMLHYGQWGRVQNKKRNLTLILNPILPAIVFHNQICVFFMIFTPLLFYGLITAYFLYVKVMSVRLYA